MSGCEIPKVDVWFEAKQHQGNIFSFNTAKKFVSLLFHTEALIPGNHAALRPSA